MSLEVKRNGRLKYSFFCKNADGSQGYFFSEITWAIIGIFLPNRFPSKSTFNSIHPTGVTGVAICEFNIEYHNGQKNHPIGHS